MKGSFSLEGDERIEEEVEKEEECLRFDADSCNRDSVIHQKENTTDERKTSLRALFFFRRLYTYLL